MALRRGRTGPCPLTAQRQGRPGTRRRAGRTAHEQAVVGAEQLGDEELEELFFDAACIYALLADEVHPERLEEVLLQLPRELVHRILDEVRPPHAHDAHVGVAVPELRAVRVPIR